MGSLVPEYQVTTTLVPGPRAFFYFIFVIFLAGVLLFQKNEKKILSVFLSFSLSFSLSLFLAHSLSIFLSPSLTHTRARARALSSLSSSPSFPLLSLFCLPTSISLSFPPAPPSAFSCWLERGERREEDGKIEGRSDGRKGREE